MKVVYVAGPYRARAENDVLRNILRSRQVALWIWRHGGVAISPHLNTAFMGGAALDETWLKGDLEIMRRCDGVVILPGWQSSEGTKAELAEARKIGLPVFFWRPHSRRLLEQWLREG